jgi:ubiquinone/menaquinone biosynthesis C-methylase UbiE
LPFGDAEFDVVTSSFGAIFAPDHQKVADELLRVCRPGGTIGSSASTKHCETSRIAQRASTASSSTSLIRQIEVRRTARPNTPTSTCLWLLGSDPMAEEGLMNFDPVRRVS